PLVSSSLSLPDALPICRPSGYLLPQGENPRPLRTVLTEAQLNRSGGRGPARDAEVDKTKGAGLAEGVVRVEVAGTEIQAKVLRVDRKSTRLNSSHGSIS